MPTDFVIERLSEQPRRMAVIGPAGSCTFGELTALSEHWGDEFEEAGVDAGSVVALEGDFSPNSIGLLLALARLGAIVVPHRATNPVGREVRYALAQVEVDVRVDETDEVRVERTDHQASHELYGELRERGHPGLVQFSSGTTGEPKAAVHDLSQLLEKFKVRRPPLRSLAFLLFDHMGGINTMLHTLTNGAALVSTDDRSPEAVCELIARHEVELLPATPSFLSLLLLHRAHRRHDLSSLRVISYGAEPMPATTLVRLHDAFPKVKLQQTYGMIELGVMRTRSRADDSLWVNVGGEGVETRVRDGMLQVRSQSQLLGYLNASAPIDADGWFATGDLVEQDGEYLRFLGRETDLINVGGEKVYPAEVEGVIESMDGVIEATVHGESNGLVGQIVCARIAVRKGESEGDLPKRVKRFCRERLERFKIPVKVEVVVGERTGEPVKKPRRVIQGGG